MYTIVLAGGAGTRLFPLSRHKYPKQFIPLLGTDSLFQKTIQRALIFSAEDEIYIITNTEHKFLVENQLHEIHHPNCHILTEPCGKNTLPAILYGTLTIHSRAPDATILVVSSDQALEPDEQYTNAITDAQALTSTHLITFGIVPISPHTGYGYIQPGIPLKHGFEVREFKEKPDENTAKEYIRNGYLWNAGIFCFSASRFIEACKQYSPAVYTAFTELTQEHAYQQTPSISIDYGILEKSSNVAVIPLKTAWTDLGTFEALYTVHEKDSDGNAVDGEYLAQSSSNNLIVSSKLVATVGIHDTAIVDTPDVLLVCPRAQSQTVKTLVERLRRDNDSRAEIHTTVYRPWGYYTILVQSKTYLVKRLVINPHKRISLQYHNHRSEHWVIVSGVAEITHNSTTTHMKTGESTYIPAKTVHRLANPTDTLLEIIEVQQGTPLTEDDIVRLNDDFKR